MRPADEIAARLYDLGTLFLWVAAPEDVVTSSSLASARDSAIARLGTPDEEVAILRLPRDIAREEHVGTIGWRLENMWSLAWVLGFGVEPPLDGMIENDLRDAILWKYLGLPERSLAELLASARVRETAIVDEMEDLFYCAHNAVRSAQLGSDTVPPDFDPIVDGGCIHERRHALTWVLSPGVTWTETDLST